MALFDVSPETWLPPAFPSSLRTVLFPVHFLTWKCLSSIAVIVFPTSSVQFTVAPWCNCLQLYTDAWRRARRHVSIPPRTPRVQAPDQRNWCHFQTLAAPMGLWRWKLRGKCKWNVSPIFAWKSRQGIKLSPSVCTPRTWSGLLWQEDSGGCKMVAW